MREVACAPQLFDRMNTVTVSTSVSDLLSTCVFIVSRCSCCWSCLMNSHLDFCVALAVSSEGRLIAALIRRALHRNGLSEEICSLGSG